MLFSLLLRDIFNSLTFASPHSIFESIFKPLLYIISLSLPFFPSHDSTFSFSNSPYTFSLLLPYTFSQLLLSPPLHTISPVFHSPPLALPPPHFHSSLNVLLHLIVCQLLQHGFAMFLIPSWNGIPFEEDLYFEQTRKMCHDHLNYFPHLNCFPNLKYFPQLELCNIRNLLYCSTR